MTLRVSIIGTGYVGLVTGACLSDFGLNVIGVDKDIEKIDKLRNGIIPIYEAGLETIVERNLKTNKLEFSTDTRFAVENSDVIFIAVGTPADEDGSADLQYVEAVCKEIATYMNGYKVIVNKSTVPVGTGKKVMESIKKYQSTPYKFDVVSNPEFLREGSAVIDFMNPDRVVIGTDNEKVREIMSEVYHQLYLKGIPFVFTNLETAELIKYASNAFLAMKITFINEIANLCDKVGANVREVARAMGMDERISPKFLNPGPGYGGSCFPKDTMALAKIGQEYSSPLTLVESTIRANDKQKLLMVEKIKSAMGKLKSKKIAVLGLAFKAETDDMREAPALTVIRELIKQGAHIKAYDPKALNEAKWRLKDLKNLEFCIDEYTSIEDADALVILTEWNQFSKLDLDKISELMNEKYFFDLRNLYERKTVESKGFKYYGVGA